MPSRRRYLGSTCAAFAAIAGCISTNDSDGESSGRGRSTTADPIHTGVPADPTADDLAVYNADDGDHRIEVGIARRESDKSLLDTSVTLAPDSDRVFEDVFPSPEEGPLIYDVRMLVDGVKTEKEFTLRDGSGFRELHLTVESKESVTAEALVH